MTIIDKIRKRIATKQMLTKKDVKEIYITKEDAEKLRRCQDSR